MTELLDAALGYAARGWPVFPLTPGKKTPATRHGVKDATTDLDRITAWWTATPEAGIGIATGPTSGIWVLDIDIDTSKDGRDTLADLEASNTPLPETLTQLTPSGGEHRVFTWPTSHDIRNSQSGRIGAGLDVRGDGGYICAEPTTLDNGRAYEFDLGCDTIADAPEWLLNLVAPPPPAPTAPRSSVTRTDRPGDRWAAATDWADILTPDGWTLATTHGQERRWVRPGKNPRDGASATTGHSAADTLKIFTSSLTDIGLMPDEHYTKLGYLAATRHHGDLADAAAALAEAGWGEERPDADALGLTTLTTTPAAAAPHEWAEPQPLTDTPDLPAWPVHILPDWMANHIRETAEELQVPVDLCAQFALGALATACMGYTHVRIGRWREPLNLYLATALGSGGGKSPAEKAMTAPIRQWETDRRTASIDDVTRSEVERKILEKRAADAEKSAEMGSISVDDAVAARLAATKHQQIHPFRLLVDDATPEKLVQILADHNGRAAILSTEAELIDMVAGQYGRTPNINVYLKAYSEDPIMIDRKGSGGTPGVELRIDAPLLTVSLAMQPTVLNFAGASNAALESRGFLARFLYAFPPDTRGHRDRFKVLNPTNPEHAAEYARQLTSIANRCQWPVEDLTFTPEAEHALLTTFQHQENRLLDDYEPITAWLAKLQSATLRVAALLHIADRATSPDTTSPDTTSPDTTSAATTSAATEPIDQATAQRAIEAAHYWTAHALAMASRPIEDTVVEDAHRILDRVARRQIHTATPRELWLPLRRQIRTLEELVPALQHLEDRGWLRLVEGTWADVGIPRIKVTLEFNVCAVTRAKPLAARTLGKEPHEERETAHTAHSGLEKVENPSSSSIPHTHLPSADPARGVRANQRDPEPTDTNLESPRKPRVLVPDPEPTDLDHDIEQWF